MDTQSIAAGTSVAWHTFMDYAPRVAGAVLILLLGLLVSGWLSAITLRALKESRIDPTFRPMIANTINYAALAIVALIVLEQFGVQTTSFLALMGTAGLAIGLALQGILSNVAAGIVLLFLRPFEIGDQVTVSDQSGVVLGLALFNTLLRTREGTDIMVPNTNVLNNAITNMSHYPQSELVVTLRVSASANLQAAIKVMQETLDAQTLLAPESKRSISVDALTGAASEVTVRAWVLNNNATAARTDFLCDLRQKLKEADISLA